LAKTFLPDVRFKSAQTGKIKIPAKQYLLSQEKRVSFLSVSYKTNTAIHLCSVFSNIPVIVYLKCASTQTFFTRGFHTMLSDRNQILYQW